jgi:excisionase family DNA binding protein
MVQGYYTLQEAAQYLNLSVDELKQMAQRSKIRSFQDRGTLRFRIQDIQELARQRGVSSDPDMVMGEASLPPKKGEGPRSPKSPKTPPREEVPEVFDFEMGDTDPGPDAPVSPKPPPAPKSPVPQVKAQPKSGPQPKSGAQPKSGSPPKSGPQPKSGVQPKSGPQTPASPQKGSDSDVKLVAGGGDVSIAVAPDSDIKLRDKGSGARAVESSVAKPKPSSKLGTPPTSDPSKKRTSKLGPVSPKPPDSGVRLVQDSDSDVKIVGGDEVPLGDQPAATQGDSNVRLQSGSFKPTPEHAGSHLTEEINLDEEIRKEEERQKGQPRSPRKVRPKSELKFPTTSPFELSDSDVDSPTEHAPAPKGVSDSSGEGKLKDDSSDFEMTAKKDDSSNFDLAAKKSDSGIGALTGSEDALGASDDFSLELDDGGELSGPASGINLSNPVDAGISLEKQASDDSLEFDLSLEPEATPKPAQMKDAAVSDSSSEFELSLEAPGKGGPSPEDSDSEFELTLDDSSDLALQGDGSPQVKAGTDDDAPAQDIFESDFDIPAIQEEGSGEPATVDNELESSDFDIALDDSELAADEESGSQVVALDEEEVQVEEEVEVTEGDFEGLEGEEIEVQEEYDTRPPRVEVHEKILKPAPWGPVPVIAGFPCVIVMLLMGFVGFELVQSSVAHRPPGMMTRLLNDNILHPIGFSPAKLGKS